MPPFAPDLNTNANNMYSILANAAGCAPLSGGGFNPSFVLMDYVNLGQGVSAVTQMNGL